MKSVISYCLVKVNKFLIILFFFFFVPLFGTDLSEVRKAYLKCYDHRLKCPASSYLVEQRKSKSTYAAANAFDKNDATVWATNKNNGIGEYIFFPLTGNGFNLNNFSESTPLVTELSIVNGYAANNTLYKDNNRVKKAEIYLYEIQISYNQEVSPFKILKGPILNSKILIELKDTSEVQKYSIKLFPKLPAQDGGDEFVIMGQLLIKEVYPGSKFKDTCISEIYYNLINRPTSF